MSAMNRHQTMAIPTPPTSLLIILCCLMIFCRLSFSVGKAIVVTHRKNITCIDQERDALLKFKHHIQSDYCGLMSSWGNPNTPDCCTWKGVSCNNHSGHVIGLNLSGASYGWGCLDSPVISPSLGELKHLKYLDLSYNNFNGMVIPSFIGSLINLIHLNLSDSFFSGNIPHQLGNLTHLTSLDLSYNVGLSAKRLTWLSQITLLRDINLHDTDLSMVKDWFSIIGSLPLLEVLKMDDCQLSIPPSSSSSSFLQSATLRFISLSGNNFSRDSSFKWLFNTSNYSSLQQSLEHLDLSFNLLQGPIPDAIGNLKFLTYLDLSQNVLSSMIPDAITNLQSLVHMDLSYNSLSGLFPSKSGALRTMHSLSYLGLSNNRLEGSIPNAIVDLHSILQIDLSYNYLQGSIPSSLGTMHSLSYLDLSHNRLEGSIPSAIGDSHSILHIDLSNNHLQGSVPTSLERASSLSHLDLSNNHLQGPVPSSLGEASSLSHLDLSNNHLEGPIPSSLGEASSLSHLDLSNNHLQGTIPSSLGSLSLVYLNLSSNNLSGDIPCKFGIRNINPAYVNFSYNNLAGSLPKYFSNVGFESTYDFQGNPNLHTDEFQGICEEGLSLSNKEQVGRDDEEDDNKIYPGLYVSIALGFYTGFWVFCGTLTVKNSWRHAYFRFLDHVIDKIYVIVGVYLAKLRRNSNM